MKFAEPLLPGRLIRRYKRFLSDIQLENGETVTAHCANPGSMLGLTEENSEVWLSRSHNPARKLKYSWELVAVGDDLVGINTGRPNAIVEEAILANKVPELAGYAQSRREVRYGTNSRIDILLEDDGRPPCYVEVKSVTLSREPPAAEFPDSVTKRGAKHLGELSAMVKGGARAVMFYLVQRSDCDHVGIARDIDPAYDQAFRDAVYQGVEVICYGCKVGPEAIELHRRLPFMLPGAIPEANFREVVSGAQSRAQ